MAEDGLYKEAMDKLVNEYFPIMKGRVFNSQDVWQHLGITNHPDHTQYKKAVAQVLYNLTWVNKKPTLKQMGRRDYRVIERDTPQIRWWEDEGKPIEGLIWPYGIDDGSSFGFDESVLLFPGDAIVMAGEGNQGKTTWAINFMIANMDKFPCTYISSEFNEPKFKYRMSQFGKWADIFNGNGEPKFELLPRTRYIEDLIADRKDNLIIVDWIRVTEGANPWEIRGVIEDIMKPVDKGIVIIILQKRSYKKVGEGGEGSVDLSSVYLTLGKSKMWVERVKSPNVEAGYNPNYKLYGFELIDGNTKFHNIREVDSCRSCKGVGDNFGIPCKVCFGKGYIDK